MASDVAGYNV
jgi:hypothetical protein